MKILGEFFARQSEIKRRVGQSEGARKQWVCAIVRWPVEDKKDDQTGCRFGFLLFDGF